MKHLSLLPAAAAILLLGYSQADAALIDGELNITGSVIVDALNIDWTPPGTGVGDFTVDPFVQSGFFTTIAGSAGTSADLFLPAAPVGVPISIPDFLTFAADPSLSFTLTFITPGPFSSAECFDAPAAGQVCSFPGSPFGLTNPSATSSSVELVLLGTVSDGSSSPPSNFRGTYTAQFNQPYQDLLDTVFVQNGSVANTYSATFTVSSIPEPTSVVLFGLGLVGLVALRRRR